MKKKITDLSNEELIALLDPISEASSEMPQSDVQTFISALRLRPGRKKVPFSFIYKLYKFWSHKPTKRSTLGRELTRLFKKKRNKYEVFYLLGNDF